MKDLKVLVLNVCLRPDSTVLLFPIGLAYVASAIHRAGYNMEILDLDRHKKTDEELREILKEKDFDVAVMGCIVTGYKIVKKLSKIIREMKPAAKIIVGNSVADSIPKILLEKTEVDIAAIGEGDITIVDVLNKLKNKELLNEVKGIWYKEKGEIFANPMREPIEDINTIPFPKWDLFDVEVYIESATNSLNDPSIPMDTVRAFKINTARGCPFRCTFCYQVFQHYRYRPRSLDSIIAEIKELQSKYGINYISFCDDLTFYSKPQIEEFVDQVLTEGIKFYWSGDCRSDLFNSEEDLPLLRKVKESGCVGLGFSLESANREILTAMNKKLSPENYIKQKALLDKVGIDTYTSLVLGYPQETKDTIKETMDFCYNLGVYPSCGYLLPQPGSPMYKYVLDKEIVKDEEKYLLSMGDRQDLRINLTNMSNEELQGEVAKYLKRIAEKLNLSLGENLIKTRTYQKKKEITELKERTKILFVSPCTMPAREQDEYLVKKTIKRVPGLSMPIGLLEMSAYLQQEVDNLEIKFLDFSTEMFNVRQNYDTFSPISLKEFIKQKITECNFQPDVVAISVSFSSTFKSAMIIAEEVRNKWPQVKIICGGNHATNCVNRILANPVIDYVIRGEGEIPLVELIRKIQQKEKLKEPIEIEGVFDREKAVQGLEEKAPLLQDLDKIPIPNYDLLDMNIYVKQKLVGVMFTRGCPFECSYCASRTVHGRKIREKSNQRIIQELDYLIKSYQLDTVLIWDDLFAANKDKFKELAEYLKKVEVKFVFHNGLSVKLMDEELIDLLIELNTDSFNFAIESGSEYTQNNLINKRVPLDKAKRLIKYTKDKGQTVNMFIILGIPYETKELIQETVDFINSVDVDWVYLFMAQPLPGTEMMEQFVDMGVMNAETFDWDDVRWGTRNFDTAEIKAEELNKLVYDINIDYNFFNNRNLKNNNFQRAINRFSKILENYPYHLVARYCRGLAKQGLGQEVTGDFKDCVVWMRKDEEAKKLFDSYRERMPLLSPFLEE